MNVAVRLETIIPLAAQNSVQLFVRQTCQNLVCEGGVDGEIGHFL